MKSKLLIAFACLSFLFSEAQVGIGTTTPNADALLDVDATATNGGILLPRLSLTQTTLPAPLTADVAGMIVYNLATINDVTPGFYYNDGTDWIRLGAGGAAAWELLGNGGTNPATNFVGTTDAVDFVIRTNNTEKARMTSGGDLGVGIVLPTAKTHIIQTEARDAIAVDHSGTAGNGIDVEQTNAANTSSAMWLRNSGTGRGLNLNLLNTANTQTALDVSHVGTGIGRGFEIAMTGATGTGMGMGLFHDGLGRGGNISLSNAANTDIGWGVWNSGTGTGSYTQAVGDAIFGYSTGTTGSAGTFILDNTAADRNSLGLFVVYDGTGGGTAGGGNAVEISHGGNNGNAVDIFVGDPSTAPGPANTTSEYNGITVAHYATGTSPTAGRSKSAISASNNSADPTIIVNNNGTEDGAAIEAFITPSSSTAIAIYGQSAIGGGGQTDGIGVEGRGGLYGVHGVKTNAGSGFAIYGSGDYGGTGAKFFSIDHPLDPENKILNHYSIESNEVTNMYRGIVILDASGQAIVQLPSYFSAANIEPSYQLTAIGTPVQPYVLKEVVNNQFSVAGKPNTKVSWTVYAKRNDPTLRYFSNNGKHYDQEEVMKSAEMRGKYYTPEAYGKDKTQGIHYSEAREKNYSEREIFIQNQKAMTSKKPIKEQKASEEPEKEEVNASQK